MMIVHIRSLGEEKSARKIYEEQKVKEWPGLVSKQKKICEELKIQECNKIDLSKEEYRDIVTKSCHIKNGEKLWGQASKVKCARMEE